MEALPCVMSAPLRPASTARWPFIKLADAVPCQRRACTSFILLIGRLYIHINRVTCLFLCFCYWILLDEISPLVTGLYPNSQQRDLQSPTEQRRIWQASESQFHWWVFPLFQKRQETTESRNYATPTFERSAVITFMALLENPCRLSKFPLTTYIQSAANPSTYPRNLCSVIDPSCSLLPLCINPDQTAHCSS
jgi:hypothetical protein